MTVSEKCMCLYVNVEAECWTVLKVTKELVTKSRIKTTTNNGEGSANEVPSSDKRTERTSASGKDHIESSDDNFIYTTENKGSFLYISFRQKYASGSTVQSNSTSSNDLPTTRMCSNRKSCDENTGVSISNDAKSDDSCSKDYISSVISPQELPSDAPSHLVQSSVDKMETAVDSDAYSLCECLKDGSSVKLELDGHLFSAFVRVLESSGWYRRRVISYYRRLHRRGNRSSHCPLLNVHLSFPQKCVLDFAGNGRWTCVARVKHEIEIIWWTLSTLGGAYSSLGDTYSHCADVAGKISVHQLQLCMVSGDRISAAKCQIFLALSEMQKGRLGRSAYLIRKQYDFTKSMISPDKVLLNMCKGAWYKLSYLYQERREARGNKDTIITQPAVSIIA